MILLYRNLIVVSNFFISAEFMMNISFSKNHLSAGRFVLVNNYSYAENNHSLITIRNWVAISKNSR